MRLKLYLSNGIFPGRDLIITYETKSQPLEKSQIEHWINEMLVK